MSSALLYLSVEASSSQRAFVNFVQLTSVVFVWSSVHRLLSCYFSRAMRVCSGPVHGPSCSKLGLGRYCENPVVSSIGQNNRPM